MKSADLEHIEQLAAAWIAEIDRHDGVLPPERRQALDAWLAESTQHRVAFLPLRYHWRRAGRLQALRPSAVVPPQPPQEAPTPTTADAAPDLRPEPAFRWLSGWRMGALAGGLAATLALVMVWPFGGRAPVVEQHATERGEREAVKLADGSRLTLNTATVLRTAVGEAKREVWLDQGEAFFEIAHDARRPFVVHVGDRTVTVLGTKFSLYKDGDRLKVAVLEGRVQVQAPRLQPAVLVRDDTALADDHSLLIVRQPTRRVVASLSWMQGKLVFDQATLAEAAAQFNRYGSKRLIIDDEAAAAMGVGGIFDADNLEAFARLLQMGFGLQVRTEGDEIHVSSR